MEDLELMPYIFWSFLGLFIIVFFLSGIRIIKEWERAPILRLGRYIGLKGPGIIYVIPLIDRIPNKISLRIQTISFSSEQTLTKDNVPVNVDAVMYVKVIDPEKAILNIENYYQASLWAAQTTLREVIGRIELQELLSHREMVGQELRKIIDEKTEEWGIKVISVEVKDVIIPQILQDAMSRQAQAERERQARITLAKAEWQAAELMLKAAQLYEENKTALLLRWMNMIYEIGQQPGTNTLIFVPTNIPEAGPSINILGVKGLEELSKDNKKSNT
ncbi:MAG: slipin family protein [Thermoproteales archaeon]|nr:slipin family protein [Thermoproteales archaeon]